MQPADMDHWMYHCMDAVRAAPRGRGAPRACFTPSSPIPVGHSSEATSLNSAIFRPTPTPHPSDPDPATYMVALSALRRVRPYRWRPLSPTTAICSLPESLAEAATWQQAQALMTVTQHGGTSSPALMAANGMPFATGIGSTTVVHVGGDHPRRRQANVGWLQ